MDQDLEEDRYSDWHLHMQLPTVHHTDSAIRIFSVFARIGPFLTEFRIFQDHIPYIGPNIRFPKKVLTEWCNYAVNHFSVKPVLQLHSHSMTFPRTVELFSCSRIQYGTGAPLCRLATNRI